LGSDLVVKALGGISNGFADFVGRRDKFAAEGTGEVALTSKARLDSFLSTHLL
jgi:hypothetical protein